MMTLLRKWPVFLLVAALTLGITALGASGGDDEDDDDGCSDEIELDEAAVFIEWNSTDDDYGIQFFWDGEPWKKMNIYNSKDQLALKIRTKKNLRKQGMTEGFFESAEPDTSELSLEEFLKRHPEGEYEFEGLTIEGDELEGEAEFSHTLPAPPENVVPGDGDEVSYCGFTVSFDEVTEDTEGEEIEIEFYEVIVEKEDDDPILQVFSVILAPDVTAVDVPKQFLEPNTEYKIEIIAQIEGGNRTITEIVEIETDGP